MDKCARCGEEGQDRRTLWMSCFYEMTEYDVPYKVADITRTILTTGIESDALFGGDLAHKQTRQRFYTLRVCKDCRADWLKAMEKWFKARPYVPEEDANIPVRIDGTVRMLTVAQYEQYLNKALDLSGAPDAEGK